MQGYLCLSCPLSISSSQRKKSCWQIFTIGKVLSLNPPRKVDPLCVLFFGRFSSLCLSPLAWTRSYPTLQQKANNHAFKQTAKILTDIAGFQVAGLTVPTSFGSSTLYAPTWHWNGSTMMKLFDTWPMHSGSGVCYRTIFGNQYKNCHAHA